MSRPSSMQYKLMNDESNKLYDEDDKVFQELVSSSVDERRDLTSFSLSNVLNKSKKSAKSMKFQGSPNDNFLDCSSYKGKVEKENSTPQETLSTLADIPSSLSSEICTLPLTSPSVIPLSSPSPLSPLSSIPTKNYPKRNHHSRSTTLHMTNFEDIKRNVPSSFHTSLSRKEWEVNKDSDGHEITSHSVGGNGGGPPFMDESGNEDMPRFSLYGDHYDLLSFLKSKRRYKNQCKSLGRVNSSIDLTSAFIREESDTHHVTHTDGLEHQRKCHENKEQENNENDCSVKKIENNQQSNNLLCSLVKESVSDGGTCHESDHLERGRSRSRSKTVMDCKKIEKEGPSIEERMHEYCRSNDVKEFKSLIYQEYQKQKSKGKLNFDVQFLNHHFHRCTVMHTASSCNSMDILMLMYCPQFKEEREALGILCSVDAKDKLEATPLIYACAGNQIDACTILLSMGANPNCRDSRGITPLIISLKKGSQEMMSRLLLFGCDVNFKGPRGNTALHCACELNDVEMCAFLMKNGSKIWVQNLNCETCLFLSLHSSTLIDFLIEKYLQTASNESDDSFSPYKMFTKLIRKKNAAGQTVIHRCARDGHVSTMMNILSNLQNSLPPNIAFNPQQQKKYVGEVIREFLNERDTAGFTPLHLAVVNKRITMIKVLLSLEEVDMNKTDFKGRTAFHLAVLYCKDALLLFEEAKAIASLCSSTSPQKRKKKRKTRQNSSMRGNINAVLNESGEFGDLKGLYGDDLKGSVRKSRKSKYLSFMRVVSLPFALNITGHKSKAGKQSPRKHSNLHIFPWNSLSHKSKETTSSSPATTKSSSTAINLSSTNQSASTSTSVSQWLSSSHEKEERKLNNLTMSQSVSSASTLGTSLTTQVSVSIGTTRDILPNSTCERRHHETDSKQSSSFCDESSSLFNSCKALNPIELKNSKPLTNTSVDGNDINSGICSKIDTSESNGNNMILLIDDQTNRKKDSTSCREKQSSSSSSSSLSKTSCQVM